MENDYFYGIFRQIADLDRNDVIKLNFYESHFAKVYEAMATDKQYVTKSTLTPYLEYFRTYLALSGGRKLLELGSGSGRILFNLARMKYDVTGVELSEDMLKIANENLEKNYSRYKRYVKMFKGDFENLPITDKYNLVIMPATTIRLLNGNLLDFLNYIYNYVDDGGYFIFDFIAEEEQSVKDEELNTFSFEEDNKIKNTVIYQEFIFGPQKKRYINFLNLRFNQNIEHYLSYTALNMLSRGDITRASEMSNFSEFSTECLSESTNSYFCILKK